MKLKWTNPSYTRVIQSSLIEAEGEEDEEGGLDLDVNLVQSMLESFTLQEGHAGPASNVLRDLGINLEKLK